jgi:4-hydroxybenzoate polyprenyltransferase
MSTVVVQLRLLGYVRRMRVYLREMYPIPARLGSAVLLPVSFFVTLGRTQRLSIALFSPLTLLGIWNVFAVGLMLRLMDELKDTDIDRQLFAHRPVPAGRVAQSDIRRTLIAVCTAFLAANLVAGPAVWMAVLVLGYALLMYRYFFAPQLLQRFLLLNLATHNPIVALLLLDLVVLFAAAYDVAVLPLLGGMAIKLLAVYWALMFSWEIARKIRASREENEYVTYSRLLGRKVAVLLAAGVQTLAFAAGLYLCGALASIWPYAVIAGAGYVNLMYEYAHFVMRNASSAHIKRYCEAFIASVWFALLVTMLFWTG